MAHVLPPVSHAAREMFAVSDLVEYGLGRIPMIRSEARAEARKFFAGSSPAIRRVVYFVLQHDDSLALVSFGRRLSPKIEWVFGPWKEF